jgi:hypothetical protein
VKDLPAAERGVAEGKIDFKGFTLIAGQASGQTFT